MFLGVAVNGKSVSVGGEAAGTVGDSIGIEVTISNCSETELPSLLLSLGSFQDHQNGNSNYRCDGIMAPAGAMTVLLPKVTIFFFFFFFLRDFIFKKFIYFLKIKSLNKIKYYFQEIFLFLENKVPQVTN